MTEYLKVDISVISTLNENSGKDNYKLSPVQTISNGYVLPSDLLTDNAWSFAFDYLNGCQKIMLSNEDFPQAQIDI